jgi:hypothetical protein
MRLAARQICKAFAISIAPTPSGIHLAVRAPCGPPSADNKTALARRKRGRQKSRDEHERVCLPSSTIIGRTVPASKAENILNVIENSAERRKDHNRQLMDETTTGQ